MSQPLFKDQVVFITGSTRGIGWSTAQVFAEQGATVILNGRSNENILSEKAAYLETHYRIPVKGILADMGNPSEISNCYKTIFQTFGKVDVVINNAGIMQPALLGMISDQTIVESFNVNVSGMIHSLQAAARLMMKKKQGVIINISSILGIHGSAGQVVYSGTKAAVIGITKAAAKELAPHGIRVNCIAPGFIKTDLVAKQSEEIIQKIALGRCGDPKEVADAILFLASPYAQYITGQVLGVDGGMIV